MTATRVVALAELPSLVGQEVGVSKWLEVTQERIDVFADATDDHQWIHVDPKRAADGPFGATVAHGFLSLALFIPLWSSILEVSDATTLVNYGLDRVRFTSPVVVGSRIRLAATLAAAEPVRGGYQLHVSGTVQIENAERPAVVLQFISRVS